MNGDMLRSHRGVLSAFSVPAATCRCLAAQQVWTAA